jgi:hypothetical protein
MKLGHMEGDFGFKALIKKQGGWILTAEFYLHSSEIPLSETTLDVKWPVEVMDNGSVYIPDEAEYK